MYIEREIYYIHIYVYVDIHVYVHYISGLNSTKLESARAELGRGPAGRGRRARTRAPLQCTDPIIKTLTKAARTHIAWHKHNQHRRHTINITKT